MHSRKRSFRQKMEAASGSSAMISCFGLSSLTKPAYNYLQNDIFLLALSIGVTMLGRWLSKHI